jgi:DNA-binding beta-propeller fold protein YncE
MGGKFITNLAMDNNRRLHYMHPFDGAHDIWQADFTPGNQLVNQQLLDTLAFGLSIIDGFTIGPDQNLYMTGYGHSQIYRYVIGSNNQTAATEVTLVAGPLGLGEFRSDLAFDPGTPYLVGIGIVPDGSGRRSLFQIPASIATNGVNNNYTWEYFGGNTSPWATIDLGSPTNPSGPLGPYPDGVAFDPLTGDLYLSGDREKLSLWNRNTATLTNYIMDSSGADTGMGFDLAFQTVPEPASIALLGIGGLALIRRRRSR